MDKKLMDLLDMALAERFGLASMDMQKENSESDKSIKKLVDMSQEIENHPGIREDARELIREFLLADSENNADLQKYLYIQGAKDCVLILREIGVIK
ncbi:hypothetical protein [Hungatella sp.]|uniref:hypothetical protein n=1 Tax=Hungatella sp. TaxID=2613924 RepID=UPI002A80DB99|nr:hypothetical protein [Hungatella sp.]